MGARDGLATSLGVIAIAAGLLASASAASRVLAKAPPPDGLATMSVDDVRPGMKGHAMTVFSGQEPERFEIEVVDIIEHYLPKQDAILFRALDPRLEHSGIVGGMSGSPIFIKGKMVGALAYGWRFNKDPLGGITPIANMKAVGELPYRPDVLPHPKTVRARGGAAGWADVMLGLDRSPLPARKRPQELDAADGLEPIAIPMSVAGLGSESTRLLADTMGLVPVRGGSAGRRARKAAGKGAPAEASVVRKWKPGDAVAVVLVRGDSSVAGNGTVTWVGPKGDRLLAFGHSMFDDGPTNVPMGDAHVHTIISSVDRSVKLSSPRTIQGLMYQDRQAAIALRTDLRAPMIPVTTTLIGADPDLPTRTYENEVAVGADLTPNLIGVILAEAADEGAHDATEVVLQLRHKLSFETSNGPREVTLEEEVFFPQGLVGRMLTQSRGVALSAVLLDNDFEVAKLRKITNEVRLQYGAPVDSVQEVRMPTSEVRAGDVLRLEVVLRSYKGDERVETLPVRVPDDAADQEIQIDVAGGDFVRPYRPLPGDLDALVTTIEQSYPTRSLVVSIYREGEGLSTKHGLMHELPDSVLETLSTPSSTQPSVRLKQLARRVIPSKTIVEGIHSIKLEVLPRKSFDP